MTETKFQEFDVFGVDERGINVVVTAAGDPVAGTRAVVLLPGDTLHVTEDIFNANADRNGAVWLGMTPDEQLERWGRIRFGVGEVSEDVAARVRRARAVELREQIRFAKRSNPAAAKAAGGLAVLEALEAELAEVTSE